MDQSSFPRPAWSRGTKNIREAELLLVVDVHELGVNHVVLGLGLTTRGSVAIGARSTRWRRARLAGGFVHGFGQFVTGRLQFRSGLIDTVDAALLHRLLGLCERFVHRFGVVGADFIAMLLQYLFDVV